MTTARIAQDSTGRGGGGMVHVVSAVVAEWRTEIHNSRPIAALNIHGRCSDGRLTAGRSLSTNRCSLANPSPIEVGRPRYLGPFDLSPARVGSVIAARVGLRSADCLVDCRRNGESACPCEWSRSPGHSGYTRRFFVEGLTAAFEAGEL